MKLKTIVIILLAVLVVGAVTAWWRNKSSDQPTFREAKVSRQDLSIKILATGVVQPENRLDIKPPVSGRVEEVLAKEGQKVKRGQLLAWMSSTERAALLDAARSQGPDEVKKWAELYRPTPILAPIVGTIIHRNVEPGQTFTSADSVFVMSDRLTVKAQVDETDIAQIQLKQEAEIVLDAYPNQVITARADQIAYDAKTVNNVTTYIVDVLPDNTPETMRSGMTANVKFKINSKPNVLAVPSEAIRIRDGKSFVQKKIGDKIKSVETEISVGINDGKLSEVLGGLSEGDTVLIPEITGLSKGQGSGANPFMPMGTPRRGGGH